MTARRIAKPPSSNRVQKHGASLGAAPARIGSRETIEVYQLWQRLDRRVDGYRRAASPSGWTFSTDRIA